MSQQVPPIPAEFDLNIKAEQPTEQLPSKPGSETLSTKYVAESPHKDIKPKSYTGDYGVDPKEEPNSVKLVQIEEPKSVLELFFTFHFRDVPTAVWRSLKETPHELGMRLEPLLSYKVRKHTKEQA